jgi:hypothetical protein
VAQAHARSRREDGLIAFNRKTANGWTIPVVRPDPTGLRIAFVSYEGLISLIHPDGSDCVDLDGDGTAYIRTGRAGLRSRRRAQMRVSGLGAVSAIVGADRTRRGEVASALCHS